LSTRETVTTDNPDFFATSNMLTFIVYSPCGRFSVLYIDLTLVYMYGGLAAKLI